MQNLAQCTQQLASCQYFLSQCHYKSILTTVIDIVEGTLTTATLLTIGVAAYAFAKYPNEIKDYVIKKFAEEKPVRAFVESINKHTTGTTFDLTVVVIRGSNIANFGVALTSLMRCIKHFVLGVFFFLPHLSTTYFHRSFVDLGGFGIGLVGIVNPAAACSMASDFLQFSWANS